MLVPIRASNDNGAHLKREALLHYFEMPFLSKDKDEYLLQDDNNQNEFFLDSEADVDNFLILSEEESKDYLFDFLLNRVEEILSEEVPDDLGRFFNREYWIEDQIKNHGLSLLARDNNVQETIYNDTRFFIFRI